MTPTATPRKRSSPLGNALLVVVTMVLGIAVAEGVVRTLNGQPLFAFPLPDALPWNDVKPADFDAVPLSPGVQKSWFEVMPPPLPNRQAPSPAWQQTYERLRAAASDSNPFRPVDAFKAWNTARLEQLCARKFFAHAPDRIYVYDPPDGEPSPPYRYYPSATYPNGLVTNQMGWRGRSIEVPRGPRTIRIVFVGSSTVLENHESPFSFPELAGHWLNMWARAKGLDVAFEVLNAARDGVGSHDIAGIVRSEVLPLRPDLVVYSEGGNQFDLGPMIEGRVPDAKPVRPGNGGTVVPEWLREASRYSALLGRVQAALGYVGSDLDGREWAKPDYKFVWPEGLDEQDPDLAFPRLPIDLGGIQRDLDRMRADLATVGGELALTSFVWMVRDGMVVDAANRLGFILQLNVRMFPFRYRDIERMANFQNRVLAKYARVHGLPFIDLAGLLPFSPSLYADAVHAAPAGSRLRGWITFQQLLPTIEKHLADRSWPSPPGPPAPLPPFAPREIAVPCREPAR
jgi:hypothetical protein